MTRKPSEIQGLLIPSNKTFYYMETGPTKVTNPIDRILKVLLAKDIITYTGTKEDVTDEKYKLMTLQEAQEKGYLVEILYLNPHVKANCAVNPIGESNKITWAKKTK
jgi:hypothetical protein